MNHATFSHHCTLFFLLGHPLPHKSKGATFRTSEYMFLLAGKIMPGTEKLQGKLLRDMETLYRNHASLQFYGFFKELSCYAPQYLKRQTGVSGKLKRKNPLHFLISTEVLQWQSSPTQLKQTVRVTISPTVCGCAPLSQPGAWVPQ